MSEQWVFGANDNDWAGWGITIAYFAAAALTFSSMTPLCILPD
jgi:hypothetical protein